MSEICFEIKEHLGVISTAPNGWRKEINIVCWNGGSDKYDIREWDENHERMSRGLTLKKCEMEKVTEIMKAHFVGK